MKQPTHLCLKPKNPDACIRDPRSRMKLPAYGARVPDNRYWRARRNDGDCVDTTADEIAAAKALEAEAAKAKAAEIDTSAKPAEAVKVPATINPKPAKRGR